jgi:hypothetical protein
MTSFIALNAWLLFAVAGALIGKSTGNAPLGAILGFFLGPLGLLIIALREDKPKATP